VIATLAIAERELKSLFVSTVAWVIAAGFLAVSGLLFSVILLTSNEASLRYLISNLSVILLFVAPFLTMRLLAEENRLGTVELLLTNPVRDIEVVLGKFLGVMGFILAMLAMTLYFPALLFIFGAFLSFAINLILWLSESVSQFVGAPVNAALKFMSITSHFQDFSRGVIDTSHLIFFISLVAAALFLTYLSLQTRRWRA
jgi:ABC-2 type transport system permease protein